MIENLFVWLFMLTVGLVAVWALHSGLEKLRVLLASLIWPRYRISIIKKQNLTQLCQSSSTRC